MYSSGIPNNCRWRHDFGWVDSFERRGWPLISQPNTAVSKASYIRFKDSLWASVNEKLYRVIGEFLFPVNRSGVKYSGFNGKTNGFGQYIFKSGNNFLCYIETLSEIDPVIKIEDHLTTSKIIKIITEPDGILVWYQWRLNEGPWSSYSTDTEILLEDIPARDYEFGIRAIHALQKGNQVLEKTLSFTVNYAFAKDVEKLIDLLLTGDRAQQVEVARQLRLIPATAESAILKRMKSATEDEKWLFEVALQKIRDSK